MCVLENSIFPDDVTEKYMQQNLPNKNMNKTLKKNLSPDIKRKLTEILKIKKELKIIIPEHNFSNFLLLGLLKMLKKAVIRINNLMNGLQKTLLYGRKYIYWSLFFVKEKWYL